MEVKRLSKEERFGLVFTSVVNTIIILLALFIYTGDPNLQRTALIEITLGEFRDGSTAQFNETRNPEVATRRNPSTVSNPEPVDQQQPVNPQEQREQPAKEVELPEQIEQVVDELITTPKTDRIDPTKTTDRVSEETVRVEQRAQRAEIEREGAETSGDVRGVRGRVDADQGTGIDPVRSAPYKLEWEGNIQRSTLIQPLPNYVAEVEAVITVRFEVRPDGTVGQIQPLRRANPELEAEIMRTLRSWRFSPLPRTAPQEVQRGVITFRFVLR